MEIEKIAQKYEALNNDLKNALSTMEKTDRVFIIRNAIKDLQHICPHDNGSFDFSTTDNCPYCGKKFKG